MTSLFLPFCLTYKFIMCNAFYKNYTVTYKVTLNFEFPLTGFLKIYDVKTYDVKILKGTQLIIALAYEHYIRTFVNYKMFKSEHNNYDLIG